MKKLERPHDVRQFVDHNKADGMTIATVAKREGPNVNDAGICKQIKEMHDPLPRQGSVHCNLVTLARLGCC